ncbi:unnamed protein product [Amoebophrya sp. A120]|nr:unnamed protein product [Amoebophrya sp. A120]|eukprot:GSA120T00025502001.1
MQALLCEGRQESKRWSAAAIPSHKDGTVPGVEEEDICSEFVLQGTGGNGTASSSPPALRFTEEDRTELIAHAGKLQDGLADAWGTCENHPSLLDEVELLCGKLEGADRFGLRISTPLALCRSFVATSLSCTTATYSCK